MSQNNNTIENSKRIYIKMRDRYTIETLLKES